MTYHLLMKMAAANSRMPIEKIEIARGNCSRADPAAETYSARRDYIIITAAIAVTGTTYIL